MLFDLDWMWRWCNIIFSSISSSCSSVLAGIISRSTSSSSDSGAAAVSVSVSGRAGVSSVTRATHDVTATLVIVDASQCLLTLTYTHAHTCIGVNLWKILGGGGHCKIGQGLWGRSSPVGLNCKARQGVWGPNLRPGENYFNNNKWSK